MSNSSRYLACLSYLLSLPAALCVLLMRRDDPFTTFHARQALALGLAGLLAPILWAAIAWMLLWIPLAGAMLGIILFALVIAAYVGLAYSSIVGILYSLRGAVRYVPLVGAWAARRRSAPAAALPEAAAELIERTSPSDA